MIGTLPALLGEPGFWLAAVPAVIIIGLSKGGFVGLGSLATPLVTLAIPPVQAAAILLPILIVQDVVGVWAFRRTVDKRVLAITLSGGLVGTAIGYRFAAALTPAHVTLAVGAIGLAFALNWWFGLATRAVAGRRPGPPEGVFWGAISGLTSFVAHAGGPPFQVYVLPQRLPRDMLVGTTAVFFAIINWVKVPPYWMLGQFPVENLMVSAALMPIAIASTFAGVRLVRRVDGGLFYKIAYALLVVVSLRLIVEGWRGVV